MTDATKNKKLPIHLQSAQRRVLIKNGRVVNTDHIFNADIYVEDGIIRQLGHNLITPGGARVIDATGKFVIPGGIDVHTQFGCDDKLFYRGTYGAVVGGTTTVIETVLPSVGEALSSSFTRHHKMADECACCDFGFHMALPQWNDQVRMDMEKLSRQSQVGSFIVKMADTYCDVTGDDVILGEVLSHCKQNGVVAVAQFEQADNEKDENGSANGSATESAARVLGGATIAAVNNLCEAADKALCPLFLTQMSLQSTLDSVCACVRQGALVFGGVSSALLALGGRQCADNENDDQFQNGRLCDETAWSCNQRRVFTDKHLVDDVINLLSTDAAGCVSTDTRSFQRGGGGGADSGALCWRNSPQDRLAVVWTHTVHTGRRDPRHFVAATSTNAAKLFNLYPRKGVIAVGSDADIVVWDGGATHCVTTNNNSNNSNMLSGAVLYGAADYVICCGGRVCVDEGQLRVARGTGRYVGTPAHGSHTYWRLTRRQDTTTKHRTALSLPVALCIPARHSEQQEDETDKGDICVADETTSEKGQSGAGSTNGFHSRSPPAEGVCHQQQSSFTAAGDQLGDKIPKRTSVKVRAPPGGRTSGSFW